MTQTSTKEKLAEFSEWLEARAKQQEAEWAAKEGWGDVKLEVRRIKEEFDAIFKKSEGCVDGKGDR